MRLGNRMGRPSADLAIFNDWSTCKSFTIFLAFLKFSTCRPQETISFVSLARESAVGGALAFRSPAGPLTGPFGSGQAHDPSAGLKRGRSESQELEPFVKGIPTARRRDTATEYRVRGCRGESKPASPPFVQTCSSDGGAQHQGTVHVKNGMVYFIDRKLLSRVRIPGLSRSIEGFVPRLPVRRFSMVGALVASRLESPTLRSGTDARGFHLSNGVVSHKSTEVFKRT
jgi:hypothetical protein